jgi:hypothetical protein
MNYFFKLCFFRFPLFSFSFSLIHKAAEKKNRQPDSTTTTAAAPPDSTSS